MELEGTCVRKVRPPVYWTSIPVGLVSSTTPIGQFRLLLADNTTCKKPVSVKNTAPVLQVLTDAMEIGDWVFDASTAGEHVDGA